MEIKLKRSKKAEEMAKNLRRNQNHDGHKKIKETIKNLGNPEFSSEESEDEIVSNVNKTPMVIKSNTMQSRQIT